MVIEPPLTFADCYTHPHSRRHPVPYVCIDVLHVYVDRIRWQRIMLLRFLDILHSVAFIDVSTPLVLHLQVVSVDLKGRYCSIPSDSTKEVVQEVRNKK